MSSDSPQVFNVPGFSIHHEISSMEDAGISPLEILKSGSVNTAKYFDRTEEFGYVEPGLSADFILVKGNPLEDLEKLKDLQGIMIRGEWIPQATLKSELDRIEAKNERK
jgi:imidazolonepropionase-like amidohydrolase